MTTIARPLPPSSLVDELNIYTKIEPANDVMEWVSSQILSQGGELYNEDHFHLIDADIKFMWASSTFEKKGRHVLGQCEEVMIRAGGWQKARAEQQMVEWFGHVPQFIITLAADYCSVCTDTDFCALVEHELYHIAQKLDEFGAPKFTQEGLPKLCIRGHDVEEFHGVVRRYGATSDVKEMIQAASKSPEVGKANIARACGTCIMKLA
ncbi:putative metallopeptidase [Vibrio sp. Vf1514]|uniref:putative metallopeptidase n=1 Tax=Vibrio sp. Vf1514 TaxID=3437381 RepID=UPI003F8ADA22